MIKKTGRKFVATGQWDPWRGGSFRIPLFISARIKIIGNAEVFMSGLVRLTRELNRPSSSALPR